MKAGTVIHNYMQSSNLYVSNRMLLFMALRLYTIMALYTTVKDHTLTETHTSKLTTKSNADIITCFLKPISLKSERAKLN